MQARQLAQHPQLIQTARSTEHVILLPLHHHRRLFSCCCLLFYAPLSDFLLYHDEHELASNPTILLFLHRHRHRHSHRHTREEN